MINLLSNIDKKILSAEDVLQNFILFNLASSFREIDKELLFYRKNTNSILASNEITQIQQNIQAHDEAIAIIQNLAQENKNLFNEKITKLFIYQLEICKQYIFLNLLRVQNRLTIRDKIQYFYKKRHKIKRILYRIFGMIYT